MSDTALLQGRTAVVTGASRGIGKAIALALAENGANVAIVYAGNTQAANETLEQIKQLGVSANAYQCNVADFEAAKSACKLIIEDFQSVDILVNNAGIIKDNLLLRMTEQDFSAVLDINLKGAFNFCKLLAPSIMKSAHGRVINISSVSGLMGNYGQANYSAAKAGLIGLTKTVAKEFASRQMTCNAIAPGFIDTEMTAALPASVKESIPSTVPMKRMGSIAEVANVALFLASDLSSYVTGEVIRVDGGLCM